MAHRTAEDYHRQLLQLLPPGDPFDGPMSSVIGRLIGALAIELARVDGTAANLIEDLDPRTTTNLISEWERCVGLPSQCQPIAASLILRRLAVTQILTSRPSLNPAYLIEAASWLGWEISIKEYFPETVPGDMPLSNRFKYDVTVLDGLELIPFRVGESACGDALGEIEHAELDCLLDRIQPAYAERQYT